jgi:hypothetical protein
MPALTRKRVNDQPETWNVYYAGVRAGVICERSGAPPTSDPWQWSCGFYPGSNPGEDRYDTAASFEAAHSAFEAAWREYLPKRSEADFQEWRDERDWTERKYAHVGSGREDAGAEAKLHDAPSVWRNVRQSPP